jgi:Tfp pilus assembly protein PilN
MTALIPEFPAPTRNPHRFLTIAADLMPVEIVEGRRTRRVKWMLLYALIVFTVALLAWYGVARYQTVAAQRELDSANADVAKLEQQQNDFNELVRTRADAQAISAQLAALMANDLPWSTLLASLQKVAPNGVSIVSVTGSLQTNGASANAPSAGAPSANPSGTPQPKSSIAGGSPAAKKIGTLIINGTGTSKLVIATYIDALGKTTGLANPLLTSVTQNDTGNEFVVSVDITAEILGGRFTPTGTPKAGN